MNTWFNPQRLIQAREARGFTQAALSAVINYSMSTISKWENGHIIPEAEAIVRLSSSLGVPEIWFSRPSNQPISLYHFRSLSAATLAARRVAQIRLNWASEITSIIEEWVEHPQINIIESPTRERALKLTDDQIEQYAADLRILWKLGTRPIKNLVDTIESAGIFIIREPFGYDKMDGVSAWFDKPFVWVSSDKGNYYRSRFDIAHELGHIILHQHLHEADCTGVRYKEVERQAHLFASHFLLPREAISSTFRSVTLDNLLLEKRHWGVSVAALIMQYHNLGIITEDHKTRLFKSYSFRKWRNHEPYDDAITPETPTLLRSSIELLLSEGGFQKADILDKIMYSATDIENICALPHGFLKPNHEKPVVRKPFLRILD